MIHNSPIRIRAKNIKSKIALSIKEKDYLELLTPETMKLLGSTKCKLTKYENGENFPY